MSWQRKAPAAGGPVASTSTPCRRRPARQRRAQRTRRRLGREEDPRRNGGSAQRWLVGGRPSPRTIVAAIHSRAARAKVRSSAAAKRAAGGSSTTAAGRLRPPRPATDPRHPTVQCSDRGQQHQEIPPRPATQLPQRHQQGARGFAHLHVADHQRAFAHARGGDPVPVASMTELWPLVWRETAAGAFRGCERPRPPVEFGALRRPREPRVVRKGQNGLRPSRAPSTARPASTASGRSRAAGISRPSFRRSGSTRARCRAASFRPMAPAPQCRSIEPGGTTRDGKRPGLAVEETSSRRPAPRRRRRCIRRPRRGVSAEDEGHSRRIGRFRDLPIQFGAGRALGIGRRSWGTPFSDHSTASARCRTTAS